MKTLFVLFMTCGVLLADVLVTTSGKTLETNGPWEIRGKFIVFRNPEGEMVQLPASMVDLERSKIATEEQKAAQEAAKQPVVEPPPTAPQSIGEISARLEGKTTEEMPPAGKIQITDKSVDKFAEKNPYADNDVTHAEFEPTQTASDYLADQERFSSEMVDLKRQLAEKEAAIDAATNDIVRAEAALQDDGTAYSSADGSGDILDELDAKKAKLVKEKEDILQKMDTVERAAKQRGINNTNRAADKVLQQEKVNERSKRPGKNDEKKDDNL
ncbi:MAG: hypothetical protein H6510_12240 [Acidobacteria bacterium]|nr:hypothetical protein [Acidobacteriota bacterium]MCB9398576.1 hypothetical protein [Acidobacteriota bacterium]